MCQACFRDVSHMLTYLTVITALGSYCWLVWKFSWVCLLEDLHLTSPLAGSGDHDSWLHPEAVSRSHTRSLSQFCYSIGSRLRYWICISRPRFNEVYSLNESSAKNFGTMFSNDHSPPSGHELFTFILHAKCFSSPKNPLKFLDPLKSHTGTASESKAGSCHLSWVPNQKRFYEWSFLSTVPLWRSVN